MRRVYLNEIRDLKSSDIIKEEEPKKQKCQVQTDANSNN